MSCRQILRRLTPVFRCTSTLIPSINNSINCVNRHFVIKQNLAKNLTGSRYFSSTVDPQIINIQDEEDFMKRVIEASTKSPIVVDFHAHWCGPCKLLGPRLESIIAGEKGRVTLAKVDIDENAELAMRFNVQSVPTVYAIKNGNIVKSFIGLKDDDEIESFVKEL